MLDADIVVNNMKRKIFIYKDDLAHLGEVVDTFARECNLDSKSKEMLMQRLRDALAAFREL